MISKFLKFKIILRLNLTDLYSSDNITKVKKSKLSKHTLKAYRLIHTQYRELIRKDHFEIEANMFLKGTTGRNTDINSHLEPLYFNELTSLFCEYVSNRQLLANSMKSSAVVIVIVSAFFAALSRSSMFMAGVCSRVSSVLLFA